MMTVKSNSASSLSTSRDISECDDLYDTDEDFAVCNGETDERVILCHDCDSSVESTDASENKCENWRKEDKRRCGLTDDEDEPSLTNDGKARFIIDDVRLQTNNAGDERSQLQPANDQKLQPTLLRSSTQFKKVQTLIDEERRLYAMLGHNEENPGGGGKILVTDNHISSHHKNDDKNNNSANIYKAQATNQETAGISSKFDISSAAKRSVEIARKNRLIEMQSIIEAKSTRKHTTQHASSAVAEEVTCDSIAHCSNEEQQVAKATDLAVTGLVQHGAPPNTMLDMPRYGGYTVLQYPESIVIQYFYPELPGICLILYGNRGLKSEAARFQPFLLHDFLTLTDESSPEREGNVIPRPEKNYRLSVFRDLPGVYFMFPGTIQRLPFAGIVKPVGPQSGIPGVSRALLIMREKHQNALQQLFRRHPHYDPSIFWTLLSHFPRGIEVIGMDDGQTDPQQNLSRGFKASVIKHDIGKARAPASAKAQRSAHQLRPNVKTKRIHLRKRNLDSGQQTKSRDLGSNKFFSTSDDRSGSTDDGTSSSSSGRNSVDEVIRVRVAQTLDSSSALRPLTAPTHTPRQPLYINTDDRELVYKLSQSVQQVTTRHYAATENGMRQTALFYRGANSTGKLQLLHSELPSSMASAAGTDTGSDTSATTSETITSLNPSVVTSADSRETQLFEHGLPSCTPTTTGHKKQQQKEAQQTMKRTHWTLLRGRQHRQTGGTQHSPDYNTRSSLMRTTQAYTPQRNAQSASRVTRQTGAHRKTLQTAPSNATDSQKLTATANARTAHRNKPGHQLRSADSK